ncbi:hypothetical protein [Microcoleus sp. herbarium5]|uniref:hypothetical protein n=1 Tax=Microcoleus sp. herbarium5 TaxID=3055434 RepID=UPI002FD65B12
MKIKTQKVLDKFCPQCGSQEITYDEEFGFYKCSGCEHCWGYDEDDPDCDEVDNLGNEDLN